MDKTLQSRLAHAGVFVPCPIRASRCPPKALPTGLHRLQSPFEVAPRLRAVIRLASPSGAAAAAAKWVSPGQAVLQTPWSAVMRHLRCGRCSVPRIGLPALTISDDIDLRRTIATSALEPRTTAVTNPSPAAGNGTGNSGAGLMPDIGSPATVSLASKEATSFSSDPSPVGVMDNSTIASMDWNDWMISSTSSSSSDGGEGTLALTPSGSNGGSTTEPEAGGVAGGGDGLAGGAARAAAVASPQLSSVGSTTTATIRIAFYAVASSFDRRQLETKLRAAYGSHAVRKYPDVIHCQMSRGREAMPGSDVFFFDYGVVACWGLLPDAERDLVRNIAVQCAVQPLAERDQERDVFRCSFATNPDDVNVSANIESGAATARPANTSDTGVATTTAAATAAAAKLAAPVQPGASSDSMGSMLDVEYGPGGSLGSTSGATSTRRFTRRAERSSGMAAAAAVSQPYISTEASAVAGPHSVLSFPPKIVDDTVLLHVRHCGDIPTLLAVSYALAQSTKLSAFEKAVDTIVTETQGLPEALAEHGEVHISGKEIGKLIGRVFVLKRSVNLLGSVGQTPEFFWYAPDQLQSLYTRITEYVELSERVEQLNSRFAVLQEILELLRAQEEDRHGTRLELVVIWLIVVEVVLGVFELLELFGVIGPGGGF
ncbi:hypothetical protein Vretifemale_18578 [Volvox reticuliferus]|uniref:DUF155 domain-containing protein n=1 Tax=Volvox reticuliferus TaxID=1737510 RepID=A0A8J4CXD2_9CHLO|nr:hypothetical protein Vretifemale_18578 [Volvox reticuliferus]